MICFTSTIVSYTTDLQSRGTNFWDTLQINVSFKFRLVYAQKDKASSSPATSIGKTKHTS